MGATIYNSELTKGIVEDAHIQINRDKVPIELAEKVVPVLEVNPKLTKRCDVVKSIIYTATAGATTMLSATERTGHQFYLCGCAASIQATATCDAATANYGISVIMGGLSRNLLTIPFITLTACNVNREICFANPIKIDMDTAISNGSFTYTAGTAVRSVVIWGYYDDS